MPLTLRIVLIVISAATLILVLRKVRKSQILIEDTVFWIVISFVLVVLSIFPVIAVAASNLLGIISPANFVFLCIIFLLLIKVFFMSLKLSQLENKINMLAQTYAIRQQEHDKIEK